VLDDRLVALTGVSVSGGVQATLLRTNADPDRTEWHG